MSRSGRPRNWSNIEFISYGIEAKVVSGSTRKMDDRVAGVKSRYEPLRRIELDNSSKISSEAGDTIVLDLKRKYWRRCGWNYIKLALAETNYARSDFVENAPIIKSVSHFHTDDRLQ